MLGKLLGIITAGVFVGAAALEISKYLARDRTGKGHGRKPLPAKEHDKTAPQAKELIPDD